MPDSWGEPWGTLHTRLFQCSNVQMTVVRIRCRVELCKMSREIEYDHSLLKGRHTHTVNDWVAAVLQVDDNHPVSLRARLFDRHTALVRALSARTGCAVDRRMKKTLTPCFDSSMITLDA